MITEYASPRMGIFTQFSKCIRVMTHLCTPELVYFLQSSVSHTHTYTQHTHTHTHTQHTHTHTHTHIHTHTHTHHTHTHTHTHKCYVCVCVYVCMHSKCYVKMWACTLIGHSCVSLCTE